MHTTSISAHTTELHQLW